MEHSGKAETPTAMAAVDPLKILRHLSPGTALYARLPTADGWEVSWLIREDAKKIASLGADAGVHFRARLFREEVGGKTIALLPILVRVGPDRPGNVWATWINRHAPGTDEVLETLAGQPELSVHLFGDDCKLERTVTTRNRLALLARQVLDKLSGLPPWEMEEFDRMREQIYRRLPDAWALWQALESNKGKPG